MKQNLVDIKFMVMVLKQYVTRNLGRIVICLFLYTVIQMFIYALAMSPLTFFEQGETQNISLGLSLVTIITLLCANVLNKMFSYGLAVMMSRIVEKKYATMGYLFYGFKSQPTRILKVSLVFTFIYALIVFVAVVLLSIFREQFQTLMQTYGAIKVLTFMGIAFLLVQIIVCIPFSFTWLFVYHHPEMKVLKSFVESAKMMKGKVFHFIKFFIRSGGIDLVTVIFLQVLFLFIPSSAKELSGLSVLLNFLSFFCFISEYRVIGRFYFAVPIYFYSSLGLIYPVKKPVQPQEPSLQIHDDL